MEKLNLDEAREMKELTDRIVANLKAINEDDNTASLALALDVAGYFELSANRAREIAAEVGRAVAEWRDVAARHGLTEQEIARMASAFEHRDLELAQSR